VLSSLEMNSGCMVLISQNYDLIDILKNFGEFI